MLYIELHDEPDATTEIFVDVGFEWTPDAAEPRRNPYLVLSSAVPAPILRHVDPWLNKAVFFLDATITSVFVVTSIQVDPGEWDPVTNPQLGVVVLPKSEVATIDRDIVFAGHGAAAIGEQLRGNIAAELHRDLEFLGEELGVAPAIRMGLYSDPEAKELDWSSTAVIVGWPNYLGFGGNLGFINGQAGAHIVRMWWGTGVGVIGQLGSAVAMAICQGVALHMMVRTRRRRGFLLVKREMDRRAAATLTEEYWGQLVRPNVVLERLARFGVTPPNGVYGLA